MEQGNNRAKDACRKIACAFRDHPQEAGENYFQHLSFTLGMAARLLWTAILLLLHGLFPFMLCRAASDRMKHCQEILIKRAADQHKHD